MAKIIKEEEIKPGEGILHHGEGVDLIPANLELSSMEMNLVNAMSRELTLRNYLRDVKKAYDYVLIDCMPSLGMITINALAAADRVMIPVQAQYLPAKGMTQLVQTISKVRRNLSPELKIDGIVLTLVDARTNLARDILGVLKRDYGNFMKVYDTKIPVAVKAAVECYVEILCASFGDRRENNEETEEDHSIMSVLWSRSGKKSQLGTYRIDVFAVQEQVDGEL